MPLLTTGLATAEGGQGGGFGIEAATDRGVGPATHDEPPAEQGAEDDADATRQDRVERVEGGSVGGDARVQDVCHCVLQ